MIKLKPKNVARLPQLMIHVNSDKFDSQPSDALPEHVELGEPEYTADLPIFDRTILLRIHNERKKVSVIFHLFILVAVLTVFLFTGSRIVNNLGRIPINNSSFFVWNVIPKNLRNAYYSRLFTEIHCCTLLATTYHVSIWVRSQVGL